MKKKTDPRHLKRVRTMQDLFSWQFKKNQTPSLNLQEIISNLSEIDKLIGEIAPDRPTDQINRVDLSILRLAIYELVVKKSAPPKVVIDEAVELAKEFGSDSSASFINGALGKLITIKGIET